jgi:zinc D-Ala-D-Ala carboxypeptidase
MTDMLVCDDWRELPAGEWRWPNFRPAEFACRGAPEFASLRISVSLLDRLQALRERVGRPMVVTSGYRSAGYNATLVGAAKNSTHVQGLAADISMGNFLGDEALFYREALSLGFTGFGFYPEYRNIFMHLDLGPRRWWGNAIPWSIDPS